MWLKLMLNQKRVLKLLKKLKRNQIRKSLDKIESVNDNKK